MANQEDLRRLKQGIKTWNQWRGQTWVTRFRPFWAADLIGASLPHTNLVHGDFRRVCLSKANLSSANLEGADFSNASINEANLSSANLEGADFSNASINEADLSNANLSGANLKNSKFYKYPNLKGSKVSPSTELGDKLQQYWDIVNCPKSNRNLEGIKLSANLSGAMLYSANLKEADLEGSNLKSADLREANLESANLRGANLELADLRLSNLKNVKLNSANLTNSNLDNVSLIGASLGWEKYSYETHSGGSYGGTSTITGERVPANLQGVTIQNANLEQSNLCQVNLTGINLRDSNVQKALLNKANLSNANIQRTNLNKADLSEANLDNANIQNSSLIGANLRGASLRRANLNSTNLDNANLEGANLEGANLEEADLRRSSINPKTTKLDKKWKTIWNILNNPNCDKSLEYLDLSCTILAGADLSNAILTGVNFSKTMLAGVSLVDAVLDQATLTGACIKDWNINSRTSIVNIQCEYIYLDFVTIEGKYQFTDRLPRESNATFKPGEFEALISKQQDTIDLIFVDGIDWQAFFQSFQELRTQYQDDEITIQSIERKGKGAFVVRLETSASPEAKGAIEDSAKKLYDQNIKRLEAQVLHYAKLIEAEKAEKSTLIEIVRVMAENQGAKYDLRGAKFAGGFAAEGGYQVGGQFNDYSIQMGANMDEITRLIQSLKEITQTLPQEQQADIGIEIEELQADLADEQKRDSKRLGKRVRSLWLAACAIAVGVAGVTDFSNNVLELSEKLNVPIPIELIRQNPHILPNG
jgi:uncharacterized protein YjbI with pentapeptide repeats